MNVWLKLVADELAQVTDEQIGFAEPAREIQKNDHEVCVVDNESRRLFFLYRQYLRRAQQLAADLTLCGNAERKQILIDVHRYKMQSEIFQEMFWISCRHSSPELWDKLSIGVRKGWRLVWSNEKSCVPSLEDYLNAVFHSEPFIKPPGAKVN